jgi:alkanesulfonate monooxygenase SsuD/methylene tetrahydromethanopterin reductase-like flavin-dependent oxidoreductase (luciferase family)
MKFGLFCVYENPEGDYARAYREQTQLVLDAERCGLDEVWVAEHHFDSGNASPSILLLLTQLAALTERVRLGSAAVLLAFRDPIQVAEDVATLDQLSDGRFEFGVAKGGPFPSQNRHFKVCKDISRGRMLEALEIIEKLLAGESVSHEGDHFQLDKVSLTPLPRQARVPVHIASTTAEALCYAAKRGHGIMGASPFPRERLTTMAEHYRWFSGGRAPEFSLSRFYLSARNRSEALAEARPFIHHFAQRMQRIRQAGSSVGTYVAEAPQAFDEGALIANSLIGSHEEVAERIADLAENVGINRLLLKPASLDHSRCRAGLAEFCDEVRSRLPTHLLPGDRQAA